MLGEEREEEMKMGTGTGQARLKGNEIKPAKMTIINVLDLSIPSSYSPLFKPLSEFLL